MRLTDGELQIHHDGMCAVNLDGKDAPCSCLVHWVKALQSEADAARKALELAKRCIKERCEEAGIIDGGHALYYSGIAAEAMRAIEEATKEAV
jgi:hypothetical protein